MYAFVMVTLCAFIVALVALPLGLAMGRRAGIAAGLLLGLVAGGYLLAFGDLGSAGSDQPAGTNLVLMVQHEHHGFEHGLRRL